MSGRIELSRARTWINDGPPRSGTTGGTGRDDVEPGDILVDKTNGGVVYVNEGTKASPYWTPVGYDQAPLFGVWSDFRDIVGVPLADTDGDVILVGSGLRVFGQGAEENDAGLVVQAAGEGGTVGRFTTTNQDLHLIALGMAAGVMQPDQHKQLVVDVELTMESAITLRAMFVGFVGIAGATMDPPVSGGTTVAVLNQNDLAGLFFDVGFSDGDALFGVHNALDADATQDLAVDGDTGPTNIAAAGTFQRFRVEITAAGVMTAFVDKLEVYTVDGASAVAEELSPVVSLESTTAAIKNMDVRRFATWAYRL